MAHTRLDVQFGIMLNKIENLEEVQNKILTQQAKIMEELSLYKHFILFIKCLCASAAAILALKFGDVKSIWK